MAPGKPASCTAGYANPRAATLAALILCAPITPALAADTASPPARSEEPPATAPPVPTPPSAALRFLSPPAGRVVFGPTLVEVQVDPPGPPVARVTLFIDGAPAGEDATPPYRFEWDAGFDFASHRLEAAAHLERGEPLHAALETVRVARIEKVKVEAEPDDWVEISFVVTGADGGTVRDLDKKDFRLSVDGKETVIQTLAEERRRRQHPLSVALLLDVSRSMRDVERDRFLMGAQALLDRLRPGDEMTVISFSNDYQVHSDFTSDPRQLRAALEAVPRPNLGTNLYDALDEALERLSERAGRRAVILYSDGQATVGRPALTATPPSLDVLDQTRRASVALYWIVPHFRDARTVQETPALRNVALNSGGRWVLEREGIEKALEEIGEELQAQYHAAFYVNKSEHTRPHYEIDLSARAAGLRVQAPQLVAGSGPLARRLEEMLDGDSLEERLAAAVQLPRYGYTSAYFPLLRLYRREREAGARDVALAALLSVLREEWLQLASLPQGAAAQRHIERQIRRLNDPRALALLDTLRRDS